MDAKDAKRLGTLLRQRREGRGWSIRQLEERSGVDDSSIVRLENGRQSRPSVEKLNRLADALQLPVEDLLIAARLTQPGGLPSLRPYLRAKYPELPASAEAELSRYFDRLAKRYGVSSEGPLPGEDELPAEEPTTKRKGGSHATSKPTAISGTRKTKSAAAATSPRARTPSKRT
jgi:transcriptional regulator with XRE-family HTH domain